MNDAFSKPPAQEVPNVQKASSMSDSPKVPAHPGVIPKEEPCAPVQGPPDMSAMDRKILYGHISGSRLRGAHSPEVLNLPNYKCSDIRQNADGTTDAYVQKQRPDGSWSRAKDTTLAPGSWSPERILDAGRRVSETPAVEKPDGRQLHRQEVDGVKWAVIKDSTGMITSSFPTGGREYSLNPKKEDGTNGPT